MAVTWKKIAQEADVITKATFTTKGDVLVTTGASTPIRLAVGTNTHVLTADSGETSGVKWAAAAGGAAIPDAVAGDVLESFADSVRTWDGTTYTKKKEFAVARDGEYRIKFDLNSQVNGEIAYGRIYKNGTGEGTEQTNNTTTYVTKSEDISGWSRGDLLQLYIKHEVGGFNHNVRCRNSRIYCTQPIDTLILTD